MYARSVIISAAVLLLCTAGVSASAQSAPSGHSNLTLSMYNYTLPPGSSITVNFTVTVVNGTPGLTRVMVVGAGTLAANGIGTKVTPWAPAYAGYRGNILISAAPNATPGKYGVVIAALGADPAKWVDFVLTIPGGVAPTSTATVNSTTSMRTTSAVTTISQQQPGGGNTSTYALAAVVVAAAAAAAYLFAIKRKSTGAQKPPRTNGRPSNQNRLP